MVHKLTNPLEKAMKNLTAYVAERNFMNKMFGRRGEPILPNDVTKLSKAERDRLRDNLECDLSPENLCCDGELRGAALRAKAAKLNGALKELNKLG